VLPSVEDRNCGDVTVENPTSNQKVERKDLENCGKTRSNFQGAPSYSEIVRSK
jgi:hypothetical protein